MGEGDIINEKKYIYTFKEVITIFHFPKTYFL